jgi:hypothetical protein
VDVGTSRDKKGGMKLGKWKWRVRDWEKKATTVLRWRNDMWRPRHGPSTNVKNLREEKKRVLG